MSNYLSSLRQACQLGLPLPASDADFIAFLHRLLCRRATSLKPSTLRNYISAISSAHTDLFPHLSNPTTSHHAKLAIKGFFNLHKVLCDSPRRADGDTITTSSAALDPAIPHVLLRAVSAPRLRMSLLDRRLCLCILLGFFCLLRGSSLFHIRLRDIVVAADNHLRLTIRHDKTDPAVNAREPRVMSTLPLPPPLATFVRDTLCLIPAAPTTSAAAHLSEFIFPHRPNTSSSSTLAFDEEFAARRLTFAIQQLADFVAAQRNVDGSVVYELSAPASAFHTRSLRPGGATAATFLGYPASLIDQIGNWSSSFMQRRYVRAAANPPSLLVASILAAVFRSPAPTAASPLVDHRLDSFPLPAFSPSSCILVEPGVE